MTFPMRVTDEGDGWLVGEVEMLPGCITQGRTIEELRANMREAIDGWLAVEAEKAERLGIESSSRIEPVTV